MAIACKIYTLSDPITNEVRYIGQTVMSLKMRLGNHIRESRTNKNTYKLNWIRSLEKKGVKPIIELLDEGIWGETEIYWISQFKQWGFRLVNSTEGGDGVIRKKTEKEKKKISNAHKGKKLSAEHKEKLSKAKLGIPKPTRKIKYKIIYKNGNSTIIKGAKEAASFIGCHPTEIHRVISGKRNSVYGYKIYKI